MANPYDFPLLRLIEDQPIDIPTADSLGLTPFAQMLAGAAIGTPGPFTIGVHGQWGYGKTTVLQLAQCLIDPEKHPNVVTVWFNAWQFEREDHPLFSLIGAITDSVENHIAKNKNIADKARDGLAKLATSLRALCRGMKFSAEVGVPLLGKVGTEFDAEKALQAEELLGKQTNPLQGELVYHAAFRTLRDEAQKVCGQSESPKIVVFIDDLDRCHPDKALHLLEGIKLILCQPGFVYLLAVDRKVIEDYLDLRYGVQYGVKDASPGRRYLDKIVQLPFIIPSHRTRFGKFAEDLINRAENNQLQISGSRPLPQFEALRSVLPLLVAGTQDFNPRTYIRLVNNFLTDCAIWPALQGGEGTQYPSFSGDVATALALHRVLPERIGRRLYDALRIDDDLCLAIVTSINLDQLALWVKSNGEGPTPSESTTGPLAHTVREDILDSLRANDGLVWRVLKNNAESWLSKSDLRGAVYEFARVERAERVPVRLSPVVDRRVRRQFNLAPDAPIFAEFLAGVTKLDLSRRKTVDEDLECLKQFKNLQALDLSESDVTDAGMAHLAPLTQLRTLYLRRDGIGDDGVKQIANLPALEILSLDTTVITVAAVAELGKLPMLIELHLSKTGLDDAWLDAVIELQNLRVLSLDSTGVTDKGLQRLKRLQNLRLLRVMRTPVTKDGVAELKKALRYCEIVSQFTLTPGSPTPPES